jgi:hypothetical protein
VKRLAATKSRRALIVLVVLALGGLYFSGRLDHLLYNVGLNYHECARNGLGATFCGHELTEVRARFSRIKSEEAAREAERTKEREAQEARTAKEQEAQREISHKREKLSEIEADVAYNLELIAQGRAASDSGAEQKNHNDEHEERLLRVEIYATEAAEREP